MDRNPNTDRNGNSWSDEIKQKVWDMGEAVPAYHANTWRKDKCGSFMNRSEYGNRDSEYGWEIDHIVPVAEGGEDNIRNLQPLQWENNVEKGDKLNWKCS